MKTEIATPEQQRRVLSALSETCRLLEREESYLPHNRNQELISEYKAHIEKLEHMLSK